MFLMKLLFKAKLNIIMMRRIKRMHKEYSNVNRKYRLKGAFIK